MSKVLYFLAAIIISLLSCSCNDNSANENYMPLMKIPVCFIGNRKAKGNGAVATN